MHVDHPESFDADELLFQSELLEVRLLAFSHLFRDTWRARVVNDHCSDRPSFYGRQNNNACILSVIEILGFECRHGVEFLEDLLLYLMPFSECDHGLHRFNIIYDRINSAL